MSAGFSKVHSFPKHKVRCWGHGWEYQRSHQQLLASTLWSLETQAPVLCLPLRALLFGLISELCLPPSDPPGSHRALLFIFLSLSFSLFMFLSVVLSKYLSDLSSEF